MCVVERIVVSPSGCTPAEAVPVEVFHHCRVGQLVIAFQRQQGVAASAHAFALELAPRQGFNLRHGGMIDNAEMMIPRFSGHLC